VLPDSAKGSEEGGLAETGVGFRSIRTGDDGTACEVRTTLGKEQARELVSSQVSEFERKYALSASGCVFGISGGGDSNALAYGLAQAIPQDRLLAFTLVFGAVFSPEAAVRAGLLCQELGIEHRVL